MLADTIYCLQREHGSSSPFEEPDKSDKPQALPDRVTTKVFGACDKNGNGGLDRD